MVSWRVVAVVAATLVGISWVAAPAAPTVGSFADVERDAFYAAGVRWMEREAITTGTSPSTFSPTAAVTRAELAAFVHRMVGEPPARPHPFGDVSRAWQQGPVSWMAEKGLTTGTTPVTFAPDEGLDRGQLATFLHRLAGTPTARTGGTALDVTVDWQRGAVAWVTEVGIMTSRPGGLFEPDEPVSRGQVATVLYRWSGCPLAGWQNPLGGAACPPSLVADAIPDPSAEPPIEPLVTFLFSRSEWASTADCVFLDGSVQLGRVAEELSRRGLRATGGVVTGETGDDRTCRDGGSRRSSWADLERLRDVHGWTFVGQSRTFPDDPRFVEPTDPEGEVCGSIRDLTARGFAGADGLFVHPRNVRSATTETLATRCAAFQTAGGSGVTDLGRLGPPWVVRVAAVRGGAGPGCTPATCADVAGDYTTPDEVAAALAATPDTWRIVQLSRLVEGARLEGSVRWDCRHPDPDLHWTSSSELWCWEDLLTVLDAVPSGARVTDPATVARLVGRR